MKRSLFIFYMAICMAFLIPACSNSPGSSSNSNSSLSMSSSSSSQSTNNVSVTITSHIINTINPLFFGQNYWDWSPTIGDQVSNTGPIFKSSNIKFLRAGGDNNDWESPDPLDSSFMDNYASYCAVIGATPLLQVPLFSTSNIAARIARATNMLSYYIGIKNYPITWIGIGNEPDVYPSNSIIPSWSSFIDNFTNVAAAIKTQYPSLKIVGPELCQIYNYTNTVSDELINFLENCGSYVSAVSIHYYPSWPNSTATYDLVTNQFDYISNMYSMIFDAMTKYGQGQKLIIDECQISANPNPTELDGEASDGTFEAGLWFADFIGISSSQPNILSIMPWSLCEQSEEGFLNFEMGDSPRPIFYIYNLLSNHFLTNMISCVKLNDIRIYTYEDLYGNASIFCINWNKTVPYSVKLSFTQGVLQNTNFTYTFGPLSLTCLSISADLSQRTAYTYSSVDSVTGNCIETNNF